MGAELWYHETPWRPNAADALKALQARFLAENYNLRELLPQNLAWARESVAAVEVDDPYNLLQIYREHLALLQKLSEQPIPDSPEAQIEIVRLIWSDSGQGIGNILDLTGLGERHDEFKAHVLNEQDMLRLTGSAQPTSDEAQDAIGTINEELGRGECVCFPAYEAGMPVAWHFVGNTID